MIHKIDFKDLPDTHTPILNLCRKLVKAGHPREDKLECYRGDRLDLIVHNIGIGSELYVAEDAFRRRSDVARAS
jgi:hypothetical protein